MKSATNGEKTAAELEALLYYQLADKLRRLIQAGPDGDREPREHQREDRKVDPQSDPTILRHEHLDAIAKGGPS